MLLLERIEPGQDYRYLLHHSVAPQTLKSYTSACGLFLHYVEAKGWDMGSDSTLLDVAIANFFYDVLFIEEVSKSYAGWLLAALRLFLPEASSNLPLAARCAKGLRRLRPSIPHPPLTWDMAIFFAFELARRKEMGFPALVGTLLAFAAYLRVNEMTALIRKDIHLPSDARLGSLRSSCVVNLRHTKTGRDQTVGVKCPVTIYLLSLLCRGRMHPSTELFPFSSQQYCYAFAACRKAHRLPTKYVPHSLRHGGATHDFDGGMSVESVMAKGRWASTSTCRRYIQSGRGRLLRDMTPSSVTSTAARRMSFLNSSPPPSWALQGDDA